MAANMTSTSNSTESPPVNIALGRVPTGSSDSYGGRFAGATDGDVGEGGWWRSDEEDYPSYLVLDLGAPAVVTAMNVTGGEPGFKTLRTYRSDDGRSWTQVQVDKTPLQCLARSTTQHSGWPEWTRYVVIQMEDRCSGVHIGRFSLAEWEVFGNYPATMVRKYTKRWPHCPDLGACFAYADLIDTQAACLANPACDGFSFSAGTIDGGRGSGCFKTSCAGHTDANGGGGAGYGHSSHGYWAKRHGIAATPNGVPSYQDSRYDGLQVYGP